MPATTKGELPKDAFGRYEARTWQPAAVDGVPRRFRRSGPYRAYVPAPVTALPSAAPQVLDLYVDASAVLAAAIASARHTAIGNLASLLMRSEAHGSSMIEGYQINAGGLVAAQVTGQGSANARIVAANLAVLVRATDAMVRAPQVTVEHLVDLQAELVPSVPGVREEPVWIGGANPMEARYVAPPHELLPPLIDDLLVYVADPPDNPLIAAATAHAAFETIHPFRDGNGRVGRALIHTVLARARFTEEIVVPLSVVLLRRREEYYGALHQWQTQTSADQRSRWFTLFAEVVIESAGVLQDLTAAVAELEAQHVGQLSALRRERGLRALRHGSTAARIIERLPAHPLLTAQNAADLFQVSTVAARSALEELADAGVLRRRKLPAGRSGKTVAYQADDVLALVDSL